MGFLYGNAFFALCALTLVLLSPTSGRSYRALQFLPTTAVGVGQKQGEHQYFRPSGDAVSGIPKNNATYHRAPCPCLNTLANHGYIPRDGKDISPAMLSEALQTVFNIDASLAGTLTTSLPKQLTLADLGKHNMIEHDASLIHNDAYFGSDPSYINMTLANRLLSRQVGGVLTPKILGRFRGQRESECAATNPTYDFGLDRLGAAYAEAAALLLAMGDYETETISVAHARSFLVQEKIPDDFNKSPTPITLMTALALAIKIKLHSWVGFLIFEVVVRVCFGGIVWPVNAVYLYWMR